MIRAPLLIFLLAQLLNAGDAFAQFGQPNFIPVFPSDSQYGQDNSFNETNYLWSAEAEGFDPSLTENGEILIITTDEYRRELNQFIKWKKQLGRLVYTESVDEIGNDYLKIKKTIDYYYHQHAVRYVLLIGDNHQVKPILGSVGNVAGEAADPIYGLVDKDIYPDIFVSRIPSNNSKKLRTALNKIIRYEKGDSTNSDWYGQAIAIGSDEGGHPYYDLNDAGVKVEYPGEKDRDIARDLAEVLRKSGYGEISQIFDTAENGMASKDRLIEELNQGAGLVYYLGHGVEYEWKTTRFNNDDISRLKNKNMTPVIISVACLNGNFQWMHGDSFAESWINAGTEEDGTGAVAILASTTVQPWTPPTVGIKEMVNSIATDRYQTLGGIFTNGIIKFLRKKRKQVIETFQSWHIFGDASMVFRTKAPTEIYYSIDSSFDSIDKLNLTTEEGITATITQGYDLLARQINRSNWEIIKEREGAGDITITLSGQDKLPLEIFYSFDGQQYIQK